MIHSLKYGLKQFNFLILLSLVIALSACGMKDHEDSEKALEPKAIEIISHRGANRVAPENTYASAKLAIENGTDYVEVDVRKSKDGVYYLFHDNTLDRTTNGTGVFSEAASAYLDTLDAGSWFGHSFAGERIPKFSDYLKWIKGKAKVYIDVKDIEIGEVVSMIREQSMEDGCFFYFRKYNDILKFRETAPDLQLKMNAQNSMQLDSLINTYNPQIIETSPQDLTDELISACHNKGVKIMVYAPGDDWKSYQKVIGSKVDMIQVDNPGIFKSMMSNGEHFPRYKLIAHRGGIVEGLYNEFDPRSIQAAIDSGYYMLEIDVRETKDGVLIVNHDGEFKRFFNNPGRAEDMTWEAIRKLRSDKGDYHPLSFDTVAQMCSGKVKMMIDIKPSNPSPAFYQKLGVIMEKYNLLSDSYFIDYESRKYFWGKAKFEFRVNEAMEIKAKFDKGEDVSSHYFLFDHGNRLNAEAIKWCQHNNIAVVASVNIGHYQFENHLDGAFRDIEHLKACGVTEFQIDSDYDQWLPHQ